MSRRLSPSYITLPLKAAVLTEALEGRMKSVEIELKETKAQAANSGGTTGDAG